MLLRQIYTLTSTQVDGDVNHTHYTDSPFQDYQTHDPDKHELLILWGSD